MTAIRLASILLALSTIFACDAVGPSDEQPDEPCPATGDPLLPQLPRVQPTYTDGCEDDTWATDVEAQVTWTIELQHDVLVNSGMNLVPSADGVVAITDRTARWVTGEGEIVSQRDLGSNVFWSRVQGSTDGVLVVGGSTGGSSFYRVLNSSGTQVWLRLLDTQFGVPSVWLDGSDVLVGLLDFSDDIALRIQRWGITGSLKGELVLPTDSDQFVRDGAGRYGIISNTTLQVFDSDGTPLGSAQVGFGEYPSIFQIVGAESGFYAAGGESDAFVTRVTVEGGVEAAWTYRLGDASSEWEYAAGLAALPGGGVVIAGGEDKIRVIYPMSPLADTMQPFVLALDDDGKPMWGERIGVPGRALAVGIGSEGEVYVAGTAQSGAAGEYGFASTATWLRRYDAG